jgi:hypothetical protein
MVKITDSSLMPWGRHKGKQMIDVPAKDLIWYYDNNKCSQEIRAYIDEKHGCASGRNKTRIFKLRLI